MCFNQALETVSCTYYITLWKIKKFFVDRKFSYNRSYKSYFQGGNLLKFSGYVYLFDLLRAITALPGFVWN